MLIRVFGMEMRFTIAWFARALGIWYVRCFLDCGGRRVSILLRWYVGLCVVLGAGLVGLGFVVISELRRGSLGLVGLHVHVGNDTMCTGWGVCFF